MRILLFALSCLVVNSSAIAGYYYGPAQRPSPEAPEKTERYVALQGEGWQARSLFPEDLTKVMELIQGFGLSENPILNEAVAYLYDKNNENPLALTERWFARNQSRVTEREGSPTRLSPYQWMWFKKGAAEGLIVIERMPRAVFELDQQEEILKFYQDLGLMSYDAGNVSEKLHGKYRSIQNRGMLEVRILTRSSGADLTSRDASEILKTLGRFFKAMSDENHVAPYYLTDSADDLPSLGFSYAYTPLMESAFKASEYQSTEKEVFNEYFPEEMRREGARTVYTYSFEKDKPLEKDDSLAQGFPFN